MGRFARSRSLSIAEPIPALDPLSPPFEVVRGCTRDTQTTLVLNKKNLTLKEVGNLPTKLRQDSSVVTDADGLPVVHVKGPAFWMTNFKSASCEAR